MTIAAIGKQVLVANMSGDRPAWIVRVLTNTVVDITALTPLPEHLTAVKVHDTRAEAINATQRDDMPHAYWAGK